ncbi:MAG: hypothetical protein M1561_00610 [Gammaproteobacteria bacterium]|nr:hypothetical protein [Gammaproteobacteria bacterium]
MTTSASKIKITKITKIELYENELAAEVSIGSGSVEVKGLSRDDVASKVYTKIIAMPNIYDVKSGDPIFSYMRVLPNSDAVELRFSVNQAQNLYCVLQMAKNCLQIMDIDCEAIETECKRSFTHRRAEYYPAQALSKYACGLNLPASFFNDFIDYYPDDLNDFVGNFILMLRGLDDKQKQRYANGIRHKLAAEIKEMIDPFCKSTRYYLTRSAANNFSAVFADVVTESVLQIQPKSVYDLFDIKDDSVLHRIINFHKFSAAVGRCENAISHLSNADHKCSSERFHDETPYYGFFSAYRSSLPFHWIALCALTVIVFLYPDPTMAIIVVLLAVHLTLSTRTDAAMKKDGYSLTLSKRQTEAEVMPSSRGSVLSLPDSSDRNADSNTVSFSYSAYSASSYGAVSTTAHKKSARANHATATKDCSVQLADSKANNSNKQASVSIESKNTRQNALHRIDIPGDKTSYLLWDHDEMAALFRSSIMYTRKFTETDIERLIDRFLNEAIRGVYLSPFSKGKSGIKPLMPGVDAKSFNNTTYFQLKIRYDYNHIDDSDCRVYIRLCEENAGKRIFGVLGVDFNAHKSKAKRDFLGESFFATGSDRELRPVNAL